MSMFKFSKSKLKIEFVLEGDELKLQPIAVVDDKIVDALHKLFPEHKNLRTYELIQLFLQARATSWMKESYPTSWFQETHSVEDRDTIKSSREWNDAFVSAAKKLEIEGESEEEIIDNYMNYVYSYRLMSLENLIEESVPESASHPKLSADGNRLKD